MEDYQKKLIDEEEEALYNDHDLLFQHNNDIRQFKEIDEELKLKSIQIEEIMHEQKKVLSTFKKDINS